LFQANSYQVIWPQIYYSSYIKNIDVRTILQDTEPVRTVIQKSLKVPIRRYRCCTARLEIRTAEYAAINTSDVIYEVNITFRPDVLLDATG
jgi:hypothetical protein